MRALVLGLALAVAAASAAQAREAAWSKAAQPTVGTASAIGSPAAGCLAGGVPLAPEGDGYQVLRPSRHRFFGHPRLVAFVRSLADAARADGLGTVLVGDMAQPRGGPMPFGHGSHQTGLDVDIWFRIPAHPLASAEIEAPEPVSMVKGLGVDPKAWTRSQARLLELAARSPEVDRIFVNPSIKHHLCASTRGDRSWLAKLRPWWGHDEHFHVRLSCSVGDPNCEAQKPVPDGDGCGAELESWFPKANVPIPSNKPHHQARLLPSACAGVLGR
ncbi:MAG: penicillin-insensitive murein endopeptidase [Actinomycetota bacterium]